MLLQGTRNATQPQEEEVISMTQFMNRTRDIDALLERSTRYQYNHLSYEKEYPITETDTYDDSIVSIAMKIF